jgi:hypothetical protein
MAAVFVAALALGGLVIQILPSFYQVNADVIALALPLHLGVAVLVLAWSASRRDPSKQS